MTTYVAWCEDEFDTLDELEAHERRCALCQRAVAFWANRRVVWGD